MIILVNDANILIDLLKVGLLDAFVQLPYDFFVTDLVAAEVHEDNVDDLTPYFASHQLNKKSFNFEELLQIQLLEVSHPILSVPDCSCLFLAKKLSATMVTGDAAFRRVTEQNDIPTHGMLWIFDELVRLSLLSRKEALAKMTRLMELNPRLPQEECKRRLRHWSNARALQG